MVVSQARDDRRGEAVMDNYAANHPPACQDAIIVGLKQRLQVRADRGDDAGTMLGVV